MGSVSSSKANPVSLKCGPWQPRLSAFHSPEASRGQKKGDVKGEPQNPEGLQRSETGGGRGEAWGHGWAGPLTSFMPRQFFSRLL